MDISVSEFENDSSSQIHDIDVPTDAFIAATGASAANRYWGRSISKEGVSVVS